MEQPRLTLRRFELSDVDDFLKWASDPRITRYLRWEAVATKEEALSRLETTFMAHPCRLSICLDGRSFGYVSARPGTGDERCRVRLSYAIAAEHWGKGVATAALRMAVPRVIREFPEVVRVEALVEVENGASGRVLEKVGFAKEGLLRKYGYCKQGHVHV